MRTSEIVLILAGIVVVLAGIKAAAVIVVPFLLSAFIAIICAPALFWLQRKGVPTALALVLVIVVILGVGSLVATLVGQSVSEFSQNLPLYQEKIKAQWELGLAWVSRLGIDTDALALGEVFDPGAAMKLAGSMLNSMGNVLTNGFLILMTVMFMLLEASGLPYKIRAIMDTPDASMSRMEEFINDVKQYVALKTLTSIGTGVLIAVWLTVLDVDFALLWGVLAFALNYVPNIGSIIAALPALMLTMVQFGIAKTLIAAGGYLAVNIVVGSILEPRIMGRGLGLSTLVVFLSLLFWGWFLGPVGMLLSVPLTITVKIALDSREDTRWLSVLLGPDKELRMDEKQGSAESPAE